MSRFGHSLLAVGTAVGIVLAAISPTLAQEAASAFTAENVTHADPFGTLPIDRSRIPEHIANVAAFVAPFSDDQVKELRQRCVVITANAANYDENTVTLCNAVLALPAG